MNHIFASSSLSVTGNPDNHPSLAELQLFDGKSIAELINDTKQQDPNQRQNDFEQSDRKTLS